MTAAFTLGGVTGLGVFLLALALFPRPASLARRLAAFDAARAAAPGGGPHSPVYDGAAAGGRSREGRESEVSRRIGRAVAAFCAEQGWEFPSLRADLSLAGRSFESHLATKALLGLFGLLLGPLALALLEIAGVGVSVAVPLWLGFVLAAAFFFLPDLEVRQKAGARRRDFRHAVGAFLDLVAMNLAGGRGVPEALMAAGEVGDGWAFRRIRDALTSARITGRTPWQTLGDLGAEVRVDELRDLAAALSLVAEDGAKVRQSLTARAASLRRKELADLEGQAGERSQSMLVAQLLLAMGFLIFLTFPVVGLLLGS